MRGILQVEVASRYLCGVTVFTQPPFKFVNSLFFPLESKSFFFFPSPNYIPIFLSNAIRVCSRKLNLQVFLAKAENSLYLFNCNPDRKQHEDEIFITILIQPTSLIPLFYFST